MTWGRVLVPVLACALAAGCAGGASTPRARAPAGPPPRARSGAPTSFGRTGIPLPSSANLGSADSANLAGALDGYTLFAATGTSVSVLNLATGQAAGSETPAYAVVRFPAGENSRPPAVMVVNAGGQRVALAGYVVQIPGEGTVPPSAALELDAVDGGAHRPWEILAPLPGQPSDLAGDPAVSVVGSAGHDVVAVVGDAGDGYRTVAFDLARQETAWQDPSFVAEAVAGNTVVGTSDDSPGAGLGGHSGGGTLRVSGIDIRTGKTEWRRPEPVSAANAQRAGPDQVLVEAAGASGQDRVSLLGARSGRGAVIAGQPASFGGSLPWTCHSGGRDTVVCASPRGDSAFAVDGDTGGVLWRLPDPGEHRIAPDITAVYDGLVYGTTANGPLVLNARTGEDVNDAPGIAPVAVDPDVGITATPTGLEAYRAAG